MSLDEKTINRKFQKVLITFGNTVYFASYSLKNNVMNTVWKKYQNTINK